MSFIDLTLTPRDKDLGGFTVRRVLPSERRRMVGPFVFLDHMGPASFEAGKGIDVRPHPHIGLATVTYLFAGELTHRDSLGTVREIRPGAVNWMTAGRGITHSERTGESERGTRHVMDGLQSWIALPNEFEETEPDFHHHPADSLPAFRLQGTDVRLIAGRAYGFEAPVRVFSPLFYMELRMNARSRITLPAEYPERAVYVIEGQVKAGGDTVAVRSMAIFRAGETIQIEADTPALVMALGGDPLGGPRFLEWNFVSSSRARIEEAKRDWRAGRFPKVPGDELEFTPLPES
jgi:redox-sensitive bicupin YhaK (pirin superfamily)